MPNPKRLFVALLALTVVACGGGSEESQSTAPPAENQSAAPAEGAADAARKEYVLKGQIIAVSDDRMQATIKHEDIPGFMSAMTMPYKVQDAKVLEGIQPGDMIEGQLAVLPEGAILERVTKVGQAPPPGQ